MPTGRSAHDHACQKLLVNCAYSRNSWWMPQPRHYLGVDKIVVRLSITYRKSLRCTLSRGIDHLDLCIAQN